MSDLDPLPKDLRALLDEAERSPGPAPGKARVQARLDATLFGPGGGGGGGDAGPKPSGGGGLSALGKAAAIFIAGGVAGGAIVLAVVPPRVEVIEKRVEVPAETVSHPVTVHPVEVPSASASVSASASAPPPPSAPVGDTLAAERSVLDPARTALGRGDGASALDAVNRHAARYPSGKLGEEREAIAVQALVQLHRADEARARGARFHARYPGSVLAAAVDAALATLP
jgi:hypothetical protein